MTKYLSLFDNRGQDDLYRKVQLFRKSFLENGGDPVAFPKFLEENGIKVKGHLIVIDDRATALEQLLKD